MTKDDVHRETMPNETYRELFNAMIERSTSSRRRAHIYRGDHSCDREFASSNKFPSHLYTVLLSSETAGLFSFQLHSLSSAYNLFLFELTKETNRRLPQRKTSIISFSITNTFYFCNRQNSNVYNVYNRQRMGK